MHTCQAIEENRCFSNGGTNLDIHTIAQVRPEDNQFEFLQAPHGIVNPPKNFVAYLTKILGSLHGTHMGSKCTTTDQNLCTVI